MTPDERDRLARVEVEIDHAKKQLADMNGKLDQLLRAAAMGQGAWWLLLKIGGAIVLLIGAAGWLTDRLKVFGS